MEVMPKPGEFYLDCENRLYQIVTLAVHDISKETYVVYQQLYGDFSVRLLSLDRFTAGAVKRREEGPPVKEAEDNGSEKVKILSETNEEYAVLRLVDFLEAESYASKLEILRGMKGSITQSELDGIFEVMDMERTGGSLSGQTEMLEKYLELQARYAGQRLR